MFIKKEINTYLKKYNKIVIWGAGGLAKTSLKYWLSKNSIVYIVDDYLHNKEHKINQIPIFHSSYLKKNKPDLIIVCSSAYLDIFNKIQKMNIKTQYKYIYELFLLNNDNKSELKNLYIDLLATKNSNILKLIILKPQIFVNITYRLSKYFKKNILTFPFYLIFYLMHYFVCAILSIQLPLNVKAGPGLVFAHPGTIIFTGKAVLGSFVTIYHCCTVGTNLKGGSPKIGNFVTIFSGSHILGQTEIRDFSIIGALSLLLDFKGKSYTTIAGIPAKTKKQYLNLKK